MGADTTGRRGAAPWLLAALLAATFWMAQSHAVHRPVGDTERQFLTLAHTMVTERVFALDRDAAGRPEPTIVREPGYPAFLALGMAAFGDPAATDAACLEAAGPECRDILVMLRLMQSLLVVATAAVIYAAAARLVGPGPWALLPVALFLLQGNAIAAAGGSYFSEPLAGFLLVAHAWLLMRLCGARRPMAVGLLAGLLAGALVLTKAIFMFYVAGAFGFAVLGLLVGRVRRHALFRPAAAATLVACLMMGAWTVRNIAVVESPLLTQRGNGVLVTRVEHTIMGWNEVWTSFLYYAPFVGQDLAERWLPEENWRLLSRDNRAGYNWRVMHGGGEVNARAFAAMEGVPPPWNQAVRGLTPFVVIAENLPKYAVLTVSFLWRGFGVDVAPHWTGIAGLDAALGVLARLLTVLLIPGLLWAFWRGARRRDGAAVLFTLPAVYSIVVHAVLTHNLPRFIEPVVPCALVALVWLLRSGARPSASRAASPGAQAAEQRD